MFKKLLKMTLDIELHKKWFEKSKILDDFFAVDASCSLCKSLSVPKIIQEGIGITVRESRAGKKRKGIIALTAEDFSS